MKKEEEKQLLEQIARNIIALARASVMQNVWVADVRARVSVARDEAFLNEVADESAAMLMYVYTIRLERLMIALDGARP